MLTAHQLIDLSFDAFSFDVCEALVGIIDCVANMAIHGDSGPMRTIPRDKIVSLIDEAALLYATKRHNCEEPGAINPPYHNFTHALDVTQMTFCILIKYGAALVLKPVQRLALIIAAMCKNVQKQ